jgi:hypothetical protein
LLGRIGDQLTESDRAGELPREVFGSPDDVSAELRTRIEKALLVALQPETPAEKKPVVRAERMDRLIGLLRTYKPKPTQQETVTFTQRFSRRASALSSEQFETLVSQVEDAVRETQVIDQQAPTVHRGTKFDTFSELVGELLNGLASSPPGAEENEPGGNA